MSYNLLGGYMKKEEFKEFVKKHPKLINYVKNNEMTWQKFYEIYDLYGESNEAWEKYISDDQVTEPKINTIKSGIGGFTISEVIKWLKNVDLDGLQEGINNVQRVLGVVQDLGKKENNEKSTYKPRPLYKHFED